MVRTPRLRCRPLSLSAPTPDTADTAAEPVFTLLLLALFELRLPEERLVLERSWESFCLRFFSTDALPKAEDTAPVPGPLLPTDLDLGTPPCSFCRCWASVIAMFVWRSCSEAASGDPYVVALKECRM